jgi:hypothetical protein
VVTTHARLLGSGQNEDTIAYELANATNAIALVGCIDHIIELIFDGRTGGRRARSAKRAGQWRR